MTKVATPLLPPILADFLPHSTMFRAAISRPLFAAARPTARRVSARPPVTACYYHEKVISHYEKPRNVGSKTGHL